MALLVTLFWSVLVFCIVWWFQYMTTIQNVLDLIVTTIHLVETICERAPTQASSTFLDVNDVPDSLALIRFIN